MMQNRREAVTAAGLQLPGALFHRCSHKVIVADIVGRAFALQRRVRTHIDEFAALSLITTSITKSVLLHHRRLRMLLQSKGPSHF